MPSALSEGCSGPRWRALAARGMAARIDDADVPCIDPCTDGAAEVAAERMAIALCKQEHRASRVKVCAAVSAGADELKRAIRQLRGEVEPPERHPRAAA